MDVGVLSKLEINLEREVYKKSFYEYYKVAFCQLHPGQEYDENWHAKYICDVLQAETERILAKIPREKDIIINVPPRSSKSMIASVIWPTSCWTIDPSMKFLSASYADTLADTLTRLAIDLIEYTFYQRLRGYKVKRRKELQGAGHYGTTATGLSYAFGMDGTVTGMGGDVLLLDDPQNPKKANSEIERRNTIDRYNETVSNRLNDLAVGGRIIIQQRLHEHDLTGFLMDPKEGRPADHRWICIPAEYDVEMVSPPELKKYYDDDGLFWGSRFSKSVLEAERKKGILYYAGQFGQRPVPPEGNIFKRKWFDIIEPELVNRDPHRSPMKFVIDTAFTENQVEGNDPTGILTFFEKDEDIYVVNFKSVWMEFPKLIEFLKEYIKINGNTAYSAIFIEPKASGKSVAQTLKNVPGFNVIEIEGEYLRDDKITKANSISPITMARKVKVVKGEWNKEFLDQLASFPKAVHDEAVDLLVYAINKSVSSKKLFALWA